MISFFFTDVLLLLLDLRSSGIAAGRSGLSPPVQRIIAAEAK
jgi:hypothetical protein